MVRLGARRVENDMIDDFPRRRRRLRFTVHVSHFLFLAICGIGNDGSSFRLERHVLTKTSTGELHFSLQPLKQPMKNYEKSNSIFDKVK